MASGTSGGPPSQREPSCSDSRRQPNEPDPFEGSSFDPVHGPLFCPFCWFGKPRRYFSSSDLGRHLSLRHGYLQDLFERRRQPLLNNCRYCDCEFSTFITSTHTFSISKCAFAFAGSQTVPPMSLVSRIEHSVRCHPSRVSDFHEHMSLLDMRIRCAQRNYFHEVAAWQEEERRFDAPPAECTRSRCRGKPTRNRGKNNN